MKNTDLLELIGSVKEEHILAADRPPKKRIVWLKPLATAAVLLLVIVGAYSAIRPSLNMAASTDAGAVESAAAEAPAEAAPAEGTADAAIPEAAMEEAEEAAPEAAPEEAPETPEEAPEAPAEAPVAEDIPFLEGVPDSSSERLCSIAPEVSVEYPDSIAEDDFDAASENWKNNQISEDTAAALKTFSFRTAAAVLQNQESDGCYSPLSLYQAMAILASGAEGETQAELFELMGISDLDTLYDQVGRLYRVNYKDNTMDKLRIANSLWIDNTDGNGNPVTYSQDWIEAAARNLYAELYSVEFSDAATAESLGAWIADNTGGFLTPSGQELGLTADTVLAIVNTVWYHASWAECFPEALTDEGTFTLSDGTDVTASFMHSTESGRLIDGDGYIAAERRLSTGKIRFVLPDEGVDVDSLLTEDRLADIFGDHESTAATIVWSVPKFESSATYDLADTLRSLGVASIFDPEKADFSAISDSPLFVSRVQQGTHISVNEDGIEAAAYTMFGLEAATAIEPELADFTLNRPFLYLITADDGSPLFIGVVRNPAE